MKTFTPAFIVPQLPGCGVGTGVGTGVGVGVGVGGGVGTGGGGGVGVGGGRTGTPKPTVSVAGMSIVWAMFAIVSVTVYVPCEENACVVLCPVAVVPSPKFQLNVCVPQPKS